MFKNTFFRKILFYSIFLIISFFIVFIIYFKILKLDTLTFNFYSHSFYINKYLFKKFKLFYFIFFLISNLIYAHLVFPVFFKEKQIKIPEKISNQMKKLHLQIYSKNSSIPIIIPKEGLYQNILITGTIGTGKTSSAMYPFTKQLISFNCNSIKDKLGMLILDVKGNYYYQVEKYVKEFNRLEDLIVIG